MVLVTVVKCFYDDHQNVSMYKNRRRVMILFCCVWGFFEKWTFVHQQQDCVSKLKGCQMTDTFATAYHNLDMNFWHKNGNN